MLEYLAERIGLELDATITGVEKFGFFCQGIQLPAEGLVHISTLPDDHYDYDNRSHTLVGRKRGRIFRLGGAVRVVVAEVDLKNRNLELQVVIPKEKAKKPSPDDEPQHQHRRDKKKRR